MPTPGRFDEWEFWDREGAAFWQQIVPPEEDRALFTTAPWRGEFRWFQSPNPAATVRAGKMCRRRCGRREGEFWQAARRCRFRGARLQPAAQRNDAMGQ
jgi:hypothetical protein